MKEHITHFTVKALETICAHGSDSLETSTRHVQCSLPSYARAFMSGFIQHSPLLLWCHLPYTESMALDLWRLNEELLRGKLPDLSKVQLPTSSLPQNAVFIPPEY